MKMAWCSILSAEGAAKGLFVPKLLHGFWLLPRAVASRVLGWWPAALIPVSFSNSPWMGFLWITDTLRWLHLQPERVFPAGWSLLPLQLLPACLAQSQRERPHRMNCSHTFLNTIWIPAWGGGPPSQHAPSFIVFLSLRWFCRVHFTPFQIISEGGNNYFRSDSQVGAILPTREGIGNIWTHFQLSQLEEERMLLVSKAQSPRMLLKIL